MLRFFLVFLVLIHGLIHLLGFLKAFGLAEISQLSGRTLFPLSPAGLRTTGALWLLAALLFAGTAVLILLRQPAWWIPGLVALLLSQALIILYWQDARFGTLVNGIVLLALLPAFGKWQFDKRTQEERIALLAQAPLDVSRPDSARTAALPQPVRQWLQRSGAIGKPAVARVRLTQSGEMRTNPEGPWMPFTAEQFFTIDRPGFIWTTTVQAAPLVTLSGRDLYRDGHGHMLIKLLALVPVADARGPEIDQGTLLRFMGEMVWFPSAALNDYLHWEAVDAQTARATMEYGGVSASGVFRFDAAGDFNSFEARRYYDRKEGATLENWHIRVLEDGFKTFEGMRIPARLEVTWKLAEGDFTWLRLEIGALNY